MRLVNSVEMEMLRSEWENWLMDENFRCEQVGAALQEASSERGKSKADSIKAQLTQKVLSGGKGENDTKKQVEREENLRDWYEEYCGSCRMDHDALIRERQVLSMASI
jgi:hypothetical protein